MERKKEFLINAAYIATILAICYFFAAYLFDLFAPFILGFLIAFTLKPIIARVSGAMNIRRKPTAVTITLAVYIIFGALFCIITSRIIYFAGNFLKGFPDFYKNELLPNINKITEWIDRSAIGEAIGRGTAAAKVSELGEALIEKVISFTAQIATEAPGFLFNLCITVIASVFICIDYNKVARFISRQLPGECKLWLFEAKDAMVKKVFGILRAYLLLMGTTFLQLTVIFFLLRIENAGGLAAIISVADLLPLVGAGAILVIWGALEMIGGNFALAGGLIISGAIVAIVRNIIEPRLIGRNTGLHPVASLIAMYAGIKLFGFIGLFVAPMILLFLQEINSGGRVKLWLMPKKNKKPRDV